MSDEQQHDEGPRLTGKQRAFIDAWMGEARFNGTRAAEMAGYSGGDDPALRDRTWAAVASENLRKPKIAAEIKRRWQARNHITQDEVMSGLAAHARGAITDVVDTSRPGGVLDMEALSTNGHLVKSISWTKNGVRVEMYDAQRAYELIGKTFGMFRDVQEQAGTVKLVIDV